MKKKAFMSQKTEDFFPVRSSLLSWKEKADEVFLFHSFKGEFFTLSEFRAAVWKRSNGRRSIGEIIHEISAAFHLTDEKASLEVISALDYLAENMLIEFFPLPFSDRHLERSG
jgi:hypothetical protein